ncbi:MerR family transcriptional regulator [Nocardiopsis suaedae]|uniref:MerR family transcriptional regulator n=1 Tax=Nocardiopsis suaedae TaxID=3018444 RepID=A0ABT4TKD8_9ACTN|nr:MerR family transcriptional regulator [Nocardiopsis suaedae]MDA2805066.1 MerR family transcriptional regulator [Nocardiopsis suaedae]
MLKAVAMHIGELASHIGVSTRSLRYYEQQGLLAPARNGSGYRVYDRLAVARAGNIKSLLEVGLTTEDILHYAANGCSDRPLSETPRCPAELDTVQDRLKSLDDRITRLQRLRNRLASHESALVEEIGAETTRV